MYTITIKNGSPNYPVTNQIKIGRSTNYCDRSLESLGTHTLSPGEERDLSGVYEYDQYPDIYYKTPTNVTYWSHKSVSRDDKKIVVELDHYENNLGPGDVCDSLFIERNRGHQIRILSDDGWIDIGDGLQIYFKYQHVELFNLGDFIKGLDVGRDTFHMKNIKKTGWDGYPHPSFNPFFTKYPA
jgi:hypothetical protein